MTLTHGEVGTVSDLVAGLAGYDWLECDGFANILHTFLVQADIPHRTYRGQVFSVVDEQVIDWHVWIELDGPDGMLVADTNLKRWLKLEGLPHGIFNPLQCNHLIAYQNPITLSPLCLPNYVVEVMLISPAQALKQMQQNGTRARIF